MALLPSDQLRKEEMAVTIEAEGSNRIPHEIMEFTISMAPDAVEFALDFNQFEFDGIKLRLLAIYN